MEIVLWNRFMELNSGHPSSTVVGRNLFECFLYLPRKLVENKIKSVFILKNFACSQPEKRPYLFKFRHNRPVTGEVEYMHQDYTFIPIKNEKDEVEHICVTEVDTTDAAIYKRMHKEALDSLAKASQCDGLTGAFNRRFLEESIAKEFGRAHRYGGIMSLVMLDIDHFMLINDSHGHLAGDEVLRAATRRLNSMARLTDTLGRYGGEGFYILLPETTLEGAQAYAERIRCTIEEAEIAFGTSTIHETISIGVAQHHNEMTRHEELINAADDALYRAKNSDRNCVRCADPPSFAAVTTHCNGL